MGRVEAILFLDVFVIIYWIEAPDPFHAPLMARLWTLLHDAPDLSFAVSRLSCRQCMAKPRRDNDQTLMKQIRAFFRRRPIEQTQTYWFCHRARKSTACPAQPENTGCLASRLCTGTRGQRGVSHERSAVPAGGRKKINNARIGRRPHCLPTRNPPRSPKFDSPPCRPWSDSKNVRNPLHRWKS